MRTMSWPQTVEVAPGDAGFISVAVTNTSSVIDAYRVQVFGLDPSWIEVEPARLSLFPGETANVAINVNLPDDYPASRRSLTVNVVSDDDPGSFAHTEVALDVAPRTVTTLEVDPVTVTAGRSATFGMVLNNNGNAAVQATGYAIDPEDLAAFTFDPPQVVIPPGREQVIQVTAEGGRSWFGPPRPRTFTLGVQAEQPVEAMATFIQRPRISRWMLTLLGLLTAAAVFAAVLARSFDRVVEEARVPAGVLDQALSTGDAGGAVVPANPGSVTGSLVSQTTGAGFSGATAELYVASDPTTAVASAATDDEGAFTFPNLGRGTYLLRLSGSGVNQIWYGNAATAEDATEFDVQLGTPTELPPIQIGGIPVPVEGNAGADAAGATVTLLAPGQADPDTPAVVATAQVGPDGSFVLEDVPSPGNYQMVVEQDGFATETRGLALQPGQPVDGIEVSLRPGNGLILGTISSPTGPLGGATVSATDGTNVVETVSLTEGAIGTFALRDLAVPGQYTVTVTREGFATEARTVALTADQATGSVSTTLLPATGSIQGRALVLGAPARGLTVEINGGDVNRTTAVVSQGASGGTYSFFNLPAPRTYTLTFSGGGTIPQVRVVDLDPASGTQNPTGVDVSLSPERTTVFGLVRDVDGSLASQATVTLTDGADALTMLTSDTPTTGSFRFSDIAPGAYTLRASRVGTEEVVVLVNVSATSPPGLIEVQLGRQASLSGLVEGVVPGRPAVVRLYTPELFPNIPIEGGETTTDGNGRYEFIELDAPVSYVVAVFSDETDRQPDDSEVVRTEPGQATPVPTLRLGGP